MEQIKEKGEIKEIWVQREAWINANSLNLSDSHWVGIGPWPKSKVAQRTITIITIIANSNGILEEIYKTMQIKPI